MHIALGNGTDPGVQESDPYLVVNAIICEPPAKYASNPKWLPHKEFRELARLGGGIANELQNPEELIARLLVLTLGSKHEDDLKRFVHAYRAVTLDR